MAQEEPTECGCRDLRLSDGIPSVRYVERCNYNFDEHLHPRPTHIPIVRDSHRERGPQNTSVNEAELGLDTRIDPLEPSDASSNLNFESFADLQKCLPLNGRGSGKNDATTTITDTLDSIGVKRDSATTDSIVDKHGRFAERLVDDYNYQHNNRNGEERTMVHDNNQLHSSKTVVATTPYVYNKKRAPTHDISSLALHSDYDLSTHSLSSTTTSSETSRTSSQHVSPSGGGFLGHEDMPHTSSATYTVSVKDSNTMHQSSNMHSSNVVRTQTQKHTRTQSYTQPHPRKDDGYISGLEVQVGGSVCLNCGDSSLINNRACKHEKLMSHDGIGKGGSGYCYKAEESDCEDEVDENPEPLTTIILPMKHDGVSRSHSQQHSFEHSGNTTPSTAQGKRDSLHSYSHSYQPADAGGSKAYVSSTGKRGVYGVPHNSSTNNSSQNMHNNTHTGQGAVILPAHPPANANYSRKLSAKEKMAAARRRRHSVELLEFAGLSGCDTTTFLRHIRLHKYTLLLSHLEFSTLLDMGDEGLIHAGMNAQGARTRLLKALERYKMHLEAGNLSSPNQKYGKHDTSKGKSGRDNRDADRSKKSEQKCEIRVNGASNIGNNRTCLSYECGFNGGASPDGTYVDFAHAQQQPHQQQQQQELQLQLNHQMHRLLHQQNLAQAHPQAQIGSQQSSTSNCAMGICGCPTSGLNFYKQTDEQRSLPRHVPFTQAHTPAARGPMTAVNTNQQSPVHLNLTDETGSMYNSQYPTSVIHVGANTGTDSTGVIQHVHSSQAAGCHNPGVRVQMQPHTHNQPTLMNHIANDTNSKISKVSHHQSGGIPNKNSQEHTASDHTSQTPLLRESRSLHTDTAQQDKCHHNTQPVSHQGSRNRTNGARVNNNNHNTSKSTTKSGMNTNARASSQQYPIKGTSNKGTVLLPTCTPPPIMNSDGISPQMSCTFPMGSGSVLNTQVCDCRPGLACYSTGECVVGHSLSHPTDYVQQQIHLHQLHAHPHAQAQAHAQLRVQIQASQQAQQRLRHQQLQIAQPQAGNYSGTGTGEQGECQFGIASSVDGNTCRQTSTIRERERSISSPDTLTYYYSQQRKVRYYNGPGATTSTGSVHLAPGTSYGAAELSDQSGVHQFARGGSLVLGNGISRSLPAVYIEPNTQFNSNRNTISSDIKPPSVGGEYQYRQQHQYPNQQPYQSPVPRQTPQHIAHMRQSTSPVAQVTVPTVPRGGYELATVNATISGDAEVTDESVPDTFGLSHNTSLPTYSHSSLYNTLLAEGSDNTSSKSMTHPFITWPSFGAQSTEVSHISTTTDAYPHIKVNRTKSHSSATRVVSASETGYARSVMDMVSLSKSNIEDLKTNVSINEAFSENLGLGGQYSASTKNKEQSDTKETADQKAKQARFVYPPLVSAENGVSIFGTPINPVSPSISPLSPSDPEYTRSPAKTASTVATEEAGSNTRFHRVAFLPETRINAHHQSPPAETNIHSIQGISKEPGKMGVYPGQVGSADMEKCIGYSRQKLSIDGDKTFPATVRVVTTNDKQSIAEDATKTADSARVVVKDAVSLPSANPSDSVINRPRIVIQADLTDSRNPMSEHEGVTYYEPPVPSERTSRAAEARAASSDRAHCETDAAADEESAAVARLLSNLDLEGEKVYSNDRLSKARDFDFLSPSLDSAMDKHRVQSTSYLRDAYAPTAGTRRRNDPHNESLTNESSNDMQHQHNMEVFGPTGLTAIAAVDTHTSTPAPEPPARYPAKQIIGKLSDTRGIPLGSHESIFQTVLKMKEDGAVRKTPSHRMKTVSHTFTPTVSGLDATEVCERVGKGSVGDLRKFGSAGEDGSDHTNGYDSGYHRAYRASPDHESSLNTRRSREIHSHSFVDRIGSEHPVSAVYRHEAEAGGMGAAIGKREGCVQRRKSDNVQTLHGSSAKSAFDFTGLLSDAGRQPVPG